MKENNIIYVDFHSKEKITPVHHSNFLTTMTLKIKKIFNRKTSNKSNKISSKEYCSNNIPQ